VKPSAERAPRRVPYVLIGTLAVVWLLLNKTSAPGQIVLGVLLAIGIVWANRNLHPVSPRLRQVYLAFGLLALVVADIVRSNISVARIVLGLVRDRKVRSGFVRIPLDIRDPYSVAVIATIVTSTPGTVWVDLATDGSLLTLHVLDLRDEAEWVDWLKNRYERRLMRIFE
jgi:multicomponent K+:H+ antiporter subunit E